ncbi:MAG: hypothetical protein ABI877_04345 [Gemmatimonadaceae bacterium]
MKLEMSYVVVTDTFGTIRDVVRAVATQTMASRVELVIVCPSSGELALEPLETAGIGAVRVIEAGTVIPLSPARAVGIRAAACDFVFVGETHSFPAPSCLEALLVSHKSGNYAAVIPVIENANPKKALSWASLMLTYRHWLEPATRANIDVLSTYNACFRRELLAGFGDRLEMMLEYGSGLDTELRQNGGSFLIEPAARLGHLNVAALHGWLPDRFLGGRFWGAARSQHWSAARRCLYALGAPLIPILTASRALRSTQWAYHRGTMPRWTLTAVIVGAIATAAGELTGYVAGGGRTPVTIAEYELHRTRYI